MIYSGGRDTEDTALQQTLPLSHDSCWGHAEHCLHKCVKYTLKSVCLLLFKIPKRQMLLSDFLNHVLSFTVTLSLPPVPLHPVRVAASYCFWPLATLNLPICPCQSGQIILVSLTFVNHSDRYILDFDRKSPLVRCLCCRIKSNWGPAQQQSRQWLYCSCSPADDSVMFI